MVHVTVRINEKDEILLNKAAKKAGLGRSEYIRQLLFERGNIAEKIDFYRNVNLHIKEIEKQSIFTTQLLCQILLNQKDEETVQNVIASVKKKLEDEEI